MTNSIVRRLIFSPPRDVKIIYFILVSVWTPTTPVSVLLLAAAAATRPNLQPPQPHGRKRPKMSQSSSWLFAFRLETKLTQSCFRTHHSFRFLYSDEIFDISHRKPGEFSNNPFGQAYKSDSVWFALAFIQSLVLVLQFDISSYRLSNNICCCY